MTDTQALELQVKNLERELREVRETLVDKFAVAIAPRMLERWANEGMQHDVNKVIWAVANNLVAARSVK